MGRLNGLLNWWVNIDYPEGSPAASARGICLSEFLYYSGSCVYCVWSLGCISEEEYSSR